MINAEGLALIAVDIRLRQAADGVRDERFLGVFGLSIVRVEKILLCDWLKCNVHKISFFAAYAKAVLYKLSRGVTGFGEIAQAFYAAEHHALHGGVGVKRHVLCHDDVRELAQVGHIAV